MKSFFILSFVVLVVAIGSIAIASAQKTNIFSATSFAKGDDSDEGRSGSSNNDDDKSKDEVKVEEKKEEKKKEEVRIESREGKTRIELRQKTDGDRTRIKQEIRTDNGRIKFEVKDGETKVKVETKTGQLQGEFTIENPVATSSKIAEIENSEDKFKVKIRTRGDRFELRSKGVSTLTNFPLSFNPETSELSVTTPQGTILIKTLPQQAVQNILAANVMDRVLGQDVTESGEEPDEEDVEDVDDEEEEEGIETPEVKVEGFVGNLTVSEITVSGITFATTSNTKFEGTIVVGSGVEIKGSPENGTLIARKVELEDKVESTIKVEGVVESVTDSSIVVAGITFTRSPTTRIEGQLTIGQKVEIKGIPTTGDIPLANKVEVETPGEGMVLTEDKGVTVFKVKGQKDTRFLNLFPATFPVEATVSVETGRVLSISRPFLLNILGFLFRT